MADEVREILVPIVVAIVGAIGSIAAAVILSRSPQAPPPPRDPWAARPAGPPPAPGGRGPALVVLIAFLVVLAIGGVLVIGALGSRPSPSPGPTPRPAPTIRPTARPAGTRTSAPTIGDRFFACRRPGPVGDAGEIPVEFTRTTGGGADDGTTDDLILELFTEPIGRSFPDADEPLSSGDCALLPEDMGPGSVITSELAFEGGFCDFTGFRLSRPPGTDGIDDPWYLSGLAVTVDGVDVFGDGVANRGTDRGLDVVYQGGWEGTRAYQNRCG